MCSSIGNQSHHTSNSLSNISCDGANRPFLILPPVASAHVPQQSDKSIPSVSRSSDTEVQVNATLNYVKKIKDYLCDHDQRHIYDQFIAILRSFHKKQKTKSLDDVRLETYTEVIELFKDHKQLIQDFSLYVSYDISLAYNMRKLEITSTNHQCRTNGPECIPTEVSLTNAIENLAITSKNSHPRNNRSVLYSGPGPQRRRRQHQRLHRQKQKQQ